MMLHHHPERFVLAWRLHSRRTVYFASGNPITFTPLYDQAKTMDLYSVVAWRDFLHERGHQVTALPFVPPRPAPPVRAAAPPQNWIKKFLHKFAASLTLKQADQQESHHKSKMTKDTLEHV
jgi:hypothetical protein